jgi:hypothetical protein
MAPESCVSAIFPLLGSVFSRHLVSLLRVPSGSVPRSHRYSRDALSPAARPAALRFLRLARTPDGTLLVRVRRLFSRPPPVRLVPSALVAQGSLFVGLPFLPSRFRGGQQASQVRGKTLTRMPCSPDPGGLPRLASVGASVLPSAPSTASAPAISDFGVHSHSLLVRCLRFAVPVFPDPQRKTRFRLVANPKFLHAMRAKRLDQLTLSVVRLAGSAYVRVVQARPKRSKARC